MHTVQLHAVAVAVPDGLCTAAQHIGADRITVVRLGVQLDAKHAAIGSCTMHVSATYDVAALPAAWQTVVGGERIVRTLALQLTNPACSIGVTVCHRVECNTHHKHESHFSAESTPFNERLLLRRAVLGLLRR